MADFKAIQDKWQLKWKESKVFKVHEDKTKKKFYCLEMFPYPSASFLHMGHVKNFSIGDAIARFKRMHGYNVLYPMGYDSFGLPAENAAKKAGMHPRTYTENSIATITKYLQELGLSYDWDRTLATHEPKYYKWNQYFFIKFYEKGLLYRKKAKVNFCEHCTTVLADEEVISGKCWRCENVVVDKDLDQWFFKTTAYADQLLEDIKKLNWSDKIKAIQENWIGKSYGTLIDFKLENGELFPIFTTRPDTIFGVTFMVIALNHPKLKGLIKGTPYEKTVENFIEDVKKAEIAEDKDFLEKSGVFTGLYAINPLNNERVPIYAGNFVVADYATGMIMAVPAHDKRDYEFAVKYNIPIKIVIQGSKPNCVIVHGCLPKEETDPDKIDHYKHWMPWLKEQLMHKGISTEIPIMPQAWAPDYTAWKKELEKNTINEHTILIGHSCGAAFLVKWLGETKRKIKKLILVAPWKISHNEATQKGFYDYQIDQNIKDNVESITIFTSDNEKEDGKKSVKIFHEILGGNIIELKGRGHYIENHMGTSEFPELLKEVIKLDSAYIDDGDLVHSEQFNGLNNHKAIDIISEFINKSNLGKKTVQYKLRDWLISRQRYWGTPIPMIHCTNCGIVPVPLEELPLLLPDDVRFDLTGNPLLTSASFKHCKCPKCHKTATRETDTMGGFMDSSWYFLRYCSPNTTDIPFDRAAVNYWMPVDQYVGGIDHAVGHLIYSRFFTKVLRDMNMLDIDEPFNALFNQGFVYKDGFKMSKSHGNIVTQYEIAEKYGIDTARVFILFVAAPDKEMDWSNQGIEGTYKFLVRTFRLYEEKTTSLSNTKDKNLVSKENIVIQSVTNDTENFKMNTAIVTLMNYVNYIHSIKENVSPKVLQESLRTLALLLNPFAPHISEECYFIAGGNGFSSVATWPKVNEDKIDLKLHYIESLIENTTKDIKSVLELVKIASPKEIDIIISEEWKYEFYLKLRELVNSGIRNISELSKHIMNSELKKHGSEIMKILPKIMDKLPEQILNQIIEKDSFLDVRIDLESQFNCVVKIILAEDSKEAKAKLAAPGKPAIVVR